MDDYNKQNLELKSLFDEIDLLKRFKFVGLSTSFLIPPSPLQYCRAGGRGGYVGEGGKSKLNFKEAPGPDK
jgi:hypothetical protein